MFDLDQCDPTLFVLPRRVLTALRDDHAVDLSSTLLVGARCRNILNSAYGRPPLPSVTTDLDLGLSLSDWSEFDRLRRVLPPLGHSGIRFEIAGDPVDLLPFGGVEGPAGRVDPPQRGEPVDVTGFREVDERAALEWPLGDDVTLRLASPIGFTALKLKAWADRSVLPDYRDAGDLAAACAWFAGDESVHAELYETSAGQEVLVDFEFDVEVAAAWWLGHQVREMLTDESLHRLRSAWRPTTTTLLAAQAGSVLQPSSTLHRRRREDVMSALVSGVDNRKDGIAH